MSHSSTRVIVVLTAATRLERARDELAEVRARLDKFLRIRIQGRADPLTRGPFAVVSQNGCKTKVPLEGNALS